MTADLEQAQQAQADLERALKAQAAEPHRDPPWLRILVAIAAVLVCIVLIRAQLLSTGAINAKDDAIAAKDDTIAVQAQTIAEQQATLDEVQATLDRFTETDTCLSAFSREITETQNLYLTGGLGGLVSALALPDETPDRAGALISAVAEHDRLRNASRASVEDRDAYVAAGARPPCPIPTTD